MTRYTADGVAMVRYLLDDLPPTADDVFARAEAGLEAVEAPTVTVSEAIWTAVEKGTGGAASMDTTSDAVLRGLVAEGPIRIAPTDREDLAVFASLVDHHTLPDALLIANHRVRETEAILTKDAEFAGEETVWS